MERVYKYLKTMDVTIVKIIKKGMYFSALMSLISMTILLIYMLNYHIPSLFYIGLVIMKTSIYYMTFFIICGISFNKIKEDILS